MFSPPRLLTMTIHPWLHIPVQRLKLYKVCMCPLETKSRHSYWHYDRKVAMSKFRLNYQYTLFRWGVENMNFLAYGNLALGRAGQDVFCLPNGISKIAILPLSWGIWGCSFTPGSVTCKIIPYDIYLSNSICLGSDASCLHLTEFLSYLPSGGSCRSAVVQQVPIYFLSLTQYNCFISP